LSATPPWGILGRRRDGTGARAAQWTTGSFDYDFIVIGSSFGGSVSALRLSEKGYRVAALEMGRLLTAADFPKTNKKLRNFLVHPAEARGGVV
jgi:choline dehydrogenase-like flavoprotein